MAVASDDLAEAVAHLHISRELSQGDRGTSQINIYLDNLADRCSVHTRKGSRGLTLLAEAVEKGHLSALKLFLCDLKCVQIKHGATEEDNLFHIAVANYQVPEKGPQVFRCLLEHVKLDGIFARLEPRKRSTLHLAAGLGLTAVFETLENCAFDALNQNLYETIDGEHQTVLHHAAMYGRYETAEKILAIEPRLIARKDNKGDTVLHKSVEANKIDMFRLFLDREPQLITERNYADESPYQCAVNQQKVNRRTKAKSEEDPRGLRAISRRAASFHDDMEVILKEQLYQLPSLKNRWSELRCLLFGSCKYIMTFVPEAASLIEDSKRYAKPLTNHERAELEDLTQVIGNNLFLDLSVFSKINIPFKEYVNDLQDHNVEFNTYLKLVRLPELACVGRESCVDLKDGLRCRPEAVKVFDYLWEKGVRNILKVVVPDCPVHPHTNQAIRNLLQKFSIKRLEWRKKDLSVQTLMTAAPKLEKIRLFASGNQDVLDHWASPEGLSRLRQVYRSLLRMLVTKATNVLRLVEIRQDYDFKGMLHSGRGHSWGQKAG